MQVLFKKIAFLVIVIFNSCNLFSQSALSILSATKTGGEVIGKIIDVEDTLYAIVYYDNARYSKLEKYVILNDSLSRLWSYDNSADSVGRFENLFIEGNSIYLASIVGATKLDLNGNLIWKNTFPGWENVDPTLTWMWIEKIFSKPFYLSDPGDSLFEIHATLPFAPIDSQYVMFTFYKHSGVCKANSVGQRSKILRNGNLRIRVFHPQSGLVSLSLFQNTYFNNFYGQTIIDLQENGTKIYLLLRDTSIASDFNLIEYNLDDYYNGSSFINAGGAVVMSFPAGGGCGELMVTMKVSESFVYVNDGVGKVRRFNRFTYAVDSVYDFNNCTQFPGKIVGDSPYFDIENGVGVSAFGLNNTSFDTSLVLLKTHFENYEDSIWIDADRVMPGNRIYPSFVNSINDSIIAVAVYGFSPYGDSKIVLVKRQQFTTTSLSQKKDRSLLTIYPNPTRDFLNLRGSLADKVMIFDITGKLLKEYILTDYVSEYSINVSSFQSGIYILKSGENVFKFVKE
jgi:hypothetical protein